MRVGPALDWRLIEILPKVIGQPIEHQAGHDIRTIPNHPTGPRERDLPGFVSYLHFHGWFGIFPVPIHKSLEGSQRCIPDVTGSVAVIVLVHVAPRCLV
jgi:hypothetical protein